MARTDLMGARLFERIIGFSFRGVERLPAGTRCSTAVVGFAQVRS